LAENEIEYLEKKDISVYLKVKLAEKLDVLGKENINLLI
jgi:hypothetical protein